MLKREFFKSLVALSAEVSQIAASLSTGSYMMIPVGVRSFVVVAITATGLLAGHRATSARPVATSRLPVVEANDNRKVSGTLRDGVLTVHMVVDSACWFPGVDNGPHVDLIAWHEAGRLPQVPGPLIRVPVGTIIDATITNSLKDSAIYIWGLTTRPATNTDSVMIRPGESHTFRYEAGAPGTYVYRAAIGSWNTDKFGEQDQLTGAIVIDSANARTDDRIFMINLWSGYMRPGDTTSGANALAINGKSWPYTERITSTVGDTMRWRVINGSDRNHPMHLHGFYFRVDARGTMWRDTLYKPEERRIAVTEDMSPGHTMELMITPERPGNWLFHCHLAFHVVPGNDLPDGSEMEHSHSADPTKHMSGLVLGIVVNPRPGEIAQHRTNVRRMHLYVQEGKPRGRAPRALGYVLQRGSHAPAPDSVEIPGSIIVVNRNELTDIVVVNRLKEPTSVHWHGIELDSYSDGVPGWSGTKDQLAPMIAPNDSFVAHLTLPRSGTFIYHTHLNDIEQITSGLYGALIVLDPHKKLDSTRDHVFVAGWDGNGKNSTFLINGDSVSGPPIEMQAGVPQRLRFINIGPAGRLLFSMREDTTVTTWRAVAKDGADLSPSMSIVRPAIQRLGVGEMYDAEFTPSRGGNYFLTVGAYKTEMKYKRRIVVK
jgi:FtsP/CotA-like multicopper oxidase with cupredoxin domain